MDISKIEKYSLKYAILEKYFLFTHNYIFYKKVVYRGLKNIPADEPVILAPNHQNALMDALAIILSGNSQVVFLARSDIFTNSIIAKFMIFLKILPVYRIRDGKEKLQLNEAIFEKTVDILKQNKKVTIFPEAQHIDKRHLRKVKKGIQRVIFKFAEQTDYKKDVKIVPVGIYYSNYWNFRTTLQVRYGKPISAAKYYEQSKENLPKAIIALGKEMQTKIEAEAIHIKSLDTYDVLEAVRDIYDTEMFARIGKVNYNQDEKFSVDKKTIEITEKFAEESPEEFEKFADKVSEYTKILSDENLKDKTIEKQYSTGEIILKILFAIIALPVFLYGALNSIIAYYLPKIITSKIEDRQFESSINFGLGIFSFPIFYVLQTIPICLFTEGWYYPVAYFITAPVFGLLAFGYGRFFIKLRSQIRFQFKKKTNLYQNIIDSRKYIIEKLNNIADKYM